MAAVNFPDLTQVAAVAIGGAVGSVARFVAGFYFANAFGTSFPWATLFVNVSGSLWLGFIASLALSKPETIDPVVRLLLTTGFAGGFTTFSTLTYESLMLYENGNLNLAAANLGSNLVVGLLAVYAGTILARLL